MRQRQEKLVIAFRNLTSALLMEAVCSPQQGRLIPIPREISGGCGLAWCADPHWDEELMRVMAKNCIDYEEKRLIPLYA